MTDLLDLVASRFDTFATLAGYALCYVGGLALLTWAALAVADYVLKASGAFGKLFEFVRYRKRFFEWREEHPDDADPYR